MPGVDAFGHCMKCGEKVETTGGCMKCNMQHITVIPSYPILQEPRKRCPVCNGWGTVPMYWGEVIGIAQSTCLCCHGTGLSD